MVTKNGGSFPHRIQASVIILNGAGEDIPAIPCNKCADRLERNPERNPFPYPKPYTVNYPQNLWIIVSANLG